VIETDGRQQQEFKHWLISLASIPCWHQPVIEMITALEKVVDMSDICNFYRRLILPIRWRCTMDKTLRSIKITLLGFFDSL
jgi:hypothetical protein